MPLKSKKRPGDRIEVGDGIVVEIGRIHKGSVEVIILRDEETHPEVEKAMFDVTSWWYERGVAGFRLDAVDTLFEDPT